MAKGIIHIDFGTPKPERKPYGHFDMFPSTGQGIKEGSEEHKKTGCYNIHNIQNIADIDRISASWNV